MTEAAIQQVITEKLERAFAPAHLDVINESDGHNVPPGSETHFKVVIVSDQFESKRPVARHQMIYAELGAELQGGVHALALHTFTELEWRDRDQQAPGSPPCRGGS